MLIKKDKKLSEVFLLSFGLSFLIFLPFLIYDKGIFLFYGDYNVQQIPFYQTAVEAVRSGNIFYSFKTDLGSGFLPSYSFYLLGSPFFYIACLFPSFITPYLMAPLYMLKFATAATTGYAFLNRFTKSSDAAIIGALLYAFSGFNVYNIFFNHFNDVVAFFPLLLIALEELIENKRHGVFALAIALMASLNYFFFFGQAVFLIIYFLIRLLSGSYKGKLDLKAFLSLALETVLGVCLSAAILLPSIIYVLGNPRATETYTGMTALIYNSPQRYGSILQSFFFMPELPSRPNFFPDANAKWASLSAYLPLFSVSGALAFFRFRRRHWLTRICITLFIMSLIPILNSAFYAFNASYYARWFYMFILMLSLATALSIDSRVIKLTPSITTVAVITVAFSFIGIIPKKNDEGILEWFSLPPYPDRFWVYVSLSLLSLLLLVLLIRFYGENKDKFLKAIKISVCIITVCYSILFITLGKTHSYDDKFILGQLINKGDAIVLGDEDEFYRVDEFKGMDNTPLFWGRRSIRFFHSCVSASIMEFYPTIGVKRDVSTKPDFDLYTLRAFLSTKYIFADITEEERVETEGFVYLETQNGYDILENENFIPMGFSYDKYITEEEYHSLSETYRERILTKAIVLKNKEAEKYNGILKHLDTDEIIWSYQNFQDDCETLKSHSCSNFTETKRGFTATFNSERDRLLFFSVPFDKGFRAFVNGVETPIINATIGFSAVEVKSGENKIEFVYTPEGLNEGAVITVSAALILAAYIVITKKKEKVCLK